MKSSNYQGCAACFTKKHLKQTLLSILHYRSMKAENLKPQPNFAMKNNKNLDFTIFIPVIKHR